MKQYSDAPPPDALRQAQTDLGNVKVRALSLRVLSSCPAGLGLLISCASKDIMVNNIDAILSRGERIELLVDKTDAMSGQAWAFRRGARGVRRQVRPCCPPQSTSAVCLNASLSSHQMWWKNVKIMALCGFVGLVRSLCFFLRPLELGSNSPI